MNTVPAGTIASEETAETGSRSFSALIAPQCPPAAHASMHRSSQPEQMTTEPGTAARREFAQFLRQGCLSGHHAAHEESQAPTVICPDRLAVCRPGTYVLARTRCQRATA